MELLRRHVEETWRRVRIMSIVVAVVILYYLSTWYLSALSSAAAAAAAAARAGSPGDNPPPQLAHSTVPRDMPAGIQAVIYITRVSLPAHCLPACIPFSLPPPPCLQVLGSSGCGRERRASNTITNCPESAHRVGGRRCPCFRGWCGRE